MNMSGGFRMNGNAAPLLSHCTRNTGNRSTSFLPSVRTGGHSMNTRHATSNDVSWNQARQSFQPETGCLGFARAELPRLDDLVRFTDAGTDDADRIFKGDHRDWRIEQHPHERQRLGLFGLLLGKPASATDGKMR